MAGDGELRRSTATSGGVRRQPATGSMASKGKTVSQSQDSQPTSCGSGSATPQPPLWSYVNLMGKPPGGGGNAFFRCNFCEGQFNGSYTRVKAHLLKISQKGIQPCKKITNETLAQLKKEQKAFDNKKSTSSGSGFIDIASILHDDIQNPTKKRKVVDVHQKSIKDSFSLQGRRELDLKVATFFYANCIPFNVARSPYWRDLVTSIANSNLTGYVPPSSERLRTVLLEQQMTRVNKLLESQKFTWDQHGVSIVSDGWTDLQRRPLINFIATSANGPIFLKAIDASGEYKSAEYLKGLFMEIIEEVGKENVVQLITDNAPVCRAAGIAIEKEYPHIFWTSYAVHSLNLALKSICNPPSKEQDPHAYELCSWIEDLEKDVRNIRNFIVNHQHALSIYNKHSDLKLLRVAETRFASLIVMVKRIKRVKSALISMVTDDDWSFYRADDDDKAQAIKGMILEDKWWDQIFYFLAFTEPIWEMLRVLDCDNSTLHCVYEMWDTMIEKIQEVIFKHEKKSIALEDSAFFDHVHRILIARWDKSSNPLQCMAHTLNPKYYGKKWLTGGVGRTPPHLDLELSTNRVACINRIFIDVHQNRRANDEFERFSTGIGEDVGATVDKDNYPSLSWWIKHGTAYPTLQYLAFRLLVQPATSSCSERNWSTYSQIHTIKRNNLTSKRAENLVYVHSNLRLLSRNKEEYREGETKYWDVNVDDFNLEQENELEVVNSRFEEPCIPSTSSIVEEEEIGENDDLGIDDD
ncbi:uncharacterized protein LOC126410604 [Nymphaea colorata]|uniref:uncharacterized protein LOC126410604 n=1 Tax=Nymphaea colorata TaxID=210225 RepID=UPI00214E06E2|nr:uncharacterized protein LOC126410604 [Nymphaea colorata]